MTTAAIDKMTTHFRSKISGEMQHVSVPEWDMKIYFKNSSTLAEQTTLIDLAQKGKAVEALVETLIIKALNEDGTKMFSKSDKVTMMNEVDPGILIRVVGDINKILDTGMEIAEKN